MAKLNESVVDLSEYSEELVKQKVDGDGNCFYHSIAESIVEQGIKPTILTKYVGSLNDKTVIAKALREIAVAQIYHNTDPEDFESLRGDNIRDIETVDAKKDFLAKHSKDKEWADDTIKVALSKALGLNIFTNFENNDAVKSSVINRQTDDITKENTIFLSLQGKHYEPFLIKNDVPEELKDLINKEPKDRYSQTLAERQEVLKHALSEENFKKERLIGANYVKNRDKKEGKVSNIDNYNIEKIQGIIRVAFEGFIEKRLDLESNNALEEQVDTLMVCIKSGGVVSEGFGRESFDKCVNEALNLAKDLMPKRQELNKDKIKEALQEINTYNTHQEIIPIEKEQRDAIETLKLAMNNIGDSEILPSLKVVFKGGAFKDYNISNKQIEKLAHEINNFKSGNSAAIIDKFIIDGIDSQKAYKIEVAKALEKEPEIIVENIYLSVIQNSDDFNHAEDKVKYIENLGVDKEVATELTDELKKVIAEIDKSTEPPPKNTMLVINRDEHVNKIKEIAAKMRAGLESNQVPSHNGVGYKKVQGQNRSRE